MKYLLVILIVALALQVVLTKTRYLQPSWQRVMKEKACTVVISHVKASILWEEPYSSECFVGLTCPARGPAYCLRIPLPGEDVTLGVRC